MKVLNKQSGEIIEIKKERFNPEIHTEDLEFKPTVNDNTTEEVVVENNTDVQVEEEKPKRRKLKKMVTESEVSE